MRTTSRHDGDIRVAGALAFCAAVAFGLLAPCSKLLIGALTPLQLAALLALGAGAGSCIVAVCRKLIGGNDAAIVPSSSSLPNVGAMTVLNAVAIVLLAVGLPRVLATNGSLLLGFEVAVATVCGWLFQGRHFCYKALAAVCLICLATVLLFWNVNGATAFVPESLLIVVACALWGVQGVMEKPIEDEDPFALVFARTIVAGIVLLIVATLVDGLPAGGIAPLFALLLGFVALGAGPALLLVAKRDAGEARPAAYFSVAPFIGLVVSWGLFGLRLEPLLFGALAFMALGVWLAVDDRVFHENALAAIDPEAGVRGGVQVIGEFDRMHRPMAR